MSKTRSVAPLVMGIVGGILGILGGSCVAICGELAEALDVSAGLIKAAGYIALVAAIAGLVGGCCAKSQAWGSMVELIAGVVVAVAIVLQLVGKGGFNLWNTASAVLLIVGGAVGMSKKAEAPQAE